MSKLDKKDLGKSELSEVNRRIADIAAKLEVINAGGAEAKAIQILFGIGFQ